MAGQIIEKGERRYLVRLYNGRDQHGKKIYYSKLIHGTRTDAERFLRGLLRDKDLGVFVAPSPLSFNEYLDYWLKNSAKQKLSERTYEGYAYLLDRHVRPALGVKKLSGLQPLELQQLYTGLREGGLSPRTIQLVHTIISSSLKQAVKWRMLMHNPAQAVDRPKQIRKEMAALSPEQAAQFLNTARDDRYYILFSIALDTGARPSELLALQWKDIDFEQGLVTIRRTLDYPESGERDFKFIEPKTSKSRRSIKISQTNLNNLREHRKVQSEGRLKKGPKWQNLDLIFCTSEGKPLQRRNILRRHLRPILKKAELPETLNLYSLRHTCATLLLGANVNPKIVSERLGHASIVLTLDTYSHVLPNMQQVASENLERILFQCS